MIPNEVRTGTRIGARWTKARTLAMRTGRRGSIIGSGTSSARSWGIAGAAGEEAYRTIDEMLEPIAPIAEAATPSASARPGGEDGAVARLQFDAAMIDLDGTLVDTLDDFVEAIGRLLDDLGLPRVGARIVGRHIGRGSAHLVGSVLAEAGRGPAPADSLADSLTIYQRHYAAVNGTRSTVYPGAVAALRRLRERGIRLACVTNKPTEFSEALLRAKALDGYFETVTGGDRFGRLKPDPLPLLKTCEALGTPPARTLMVGDSVNDALAARAAGCPVVLVTYGYNHGRPVREVDADGYVDSLEALN